MKLVPETNAWPRLLAFPCLALAALGAVAFARWSEQIQQIAFCPLHRLTGLPCPTCGGTHAALAIVHLRPAAAFALNPLVTAFAVLLTLWGAYAIAATLVPRWRRNLVLPPRQRMRVRWAVAAAILAGWAFQWLRYF
jgi:hypothetical protein